MSLDLQPGDIIQVVETVELTGRPVGDAVMCRDITSGRAGRIYLGGNAHIQMVKRVARRKPQRGDFKIGDKVTADQLREVMWRRGTMICPNHHPELASVLHGDGRWHALNGEAWDFTTAEGKFELLYLPE